MELKIGERFKKYEAASTMQLIPHLPVIIRVDGRAFHTFTKKAKLTKPFCSKFHSAMIQATYALCRETHAIIAYTQSDEISLILLNDKKYETQPWFNNEINKLVSITAATASVAFSFAMSDFLGTEVKEIFDSRAFVIPPHEIVNYLIWRQVDAIRNAKNIWSEFTLGEYVGRGTARKQLHGLSAQTKIEYVQEQTGCNFKDVPDEFIYGVELIPRERGYAQSVHNYLDERDYIQGILDAYYEDDEE